MVVEDLMTSEVGSCRPFDTLDRGARIMWERDCGAVPVLDQDGRVVAMLTDRDICMAALTQGRPLSEMRVSSAMSRSLWTCRREDEVKDAEKLMRSHQVRRLPVVDADGKLVGVLSISDLARSAVAARKRTAKEKPVAAADVGKTLGAISAPAAAR
jgi:CBS domain-containing protein